MCFITIPVIENFIVWSWRQFNKAPIVFFPRSIRSVGNMIILWCLFWVFHIGDDGTRGSSGAIKSFETMGPWGHLGTMRPYIDHLGPSDVTYDSGEIFLPRMVSYIIIIWVPLEKLNIFQYSFTRISKYFGIY